MALIARATSARRRKPPVNGGNAGTPANPVPSNPDTTPAPVEPIFFEEFTANNKGKLTHAFGPTQNLTFAGGIATLGGSPANNGVGMMTFPGGKATNFGNGLFEIRAKFSSSTGNVGSGSGPANVIWPASDKWPGPEVDIGEIDYNGKLYMATHWRNAQGGDSYRPFYAPDGFDWTQWHTYSAFLQTDKITYAIDGQTIGVDSTNPAPDAANGGENHAFGVLNRSPETSLQCDWVRWTPEATVLGGTGSTGGTTTPVTQSISLSSNPPATPTEASSGAGYNFTANIVSTGYTSVSWVVTGPGPNYVWDKAERVVATTGSVSITANIPADGIVHYIRYWPTGTTGKEKFSTAVTVTPFAGGAASPAPTPTSSESYDLAGPGGGTTGDIGIMIQGQSNAVFFVDDYQKGTDPNAVDVFRTMLQQLTGLSSTQLKVKYQRNDIGQNNWTLAAGSNTYHFNIDGNNNPKWLEPVGNTLNTPSTWANTSIMTGFQTYCTAQQASVAAGRPWLLIRMHDEYDARMYNSGEVSVYEAANREFIKRWRSYMGGRSNSLLPVFMCPVSYASGTQSGMMRAMRDAWHAESQDATHNAFLGYGNALDSEDRGDASHWTLAASTRVARRLAIRVAKWLWLNGYAVNDLSWLPTHGPRIASFARVAPDSNLIDVVVYHNKGTDLIVPTTNNTDDWEVLQGGTAIPVGKVERLNSNTLRLTLNTALTPGSTVTLDYGFKLFYRGPNAMIRDNWATAAVTKPAMAASVSNLASAVMILDRARSKLTEGQAQTSASPAPVVTSPTANTSPAPATDTGSGGTTTPTPTTTTPVTTIATGTSGVADTFVPTNNYFRIGGFETARDKVKLPAGTDPATVTIAADHDTQDYNAWGMLISYGTTGQKVFLRYNYDATKAGNIIYG